LEINVNLLLHIFKRRNQIFQTLKFQLVEGDIENENIESFPEEETYEKEFNHKPTKFSEIIHRFKKEVIHDKKLY